ncbi:MAG: hypothetical protein M3R04_00855 [bacterium]|nr:hypothetical protein [bacterium]
MELIVSLPRNDMDLALAAAQGGAHALKLHMNVRHDASGTSYGSFAEEADIVRRIIGAVKIPVGLMPGADPANLPTQDELSSLASAGLDFIDIYSDNMPLWFLELPLRLIVALRSFDGFLEPPYYQTHFMWPPELNKNRIAMCEASIFPKEDYGKPFTFHDLRRLRILQEYIDAPMVVPTQKAITPYDATWLKRGGTAALMIGAIVMGDTADSIASATEAYRDAIENG